MLITASLNIFKCGKSTPGYLSTFTKRHFPLVPHGGVSLLCCISLPWRLWGQIFPMDTSQTSQEVWTGPGCSGLFLSAGSSAVPKTLAWVRDEVRGREQWEVEVTVQLHGPPQCYHTGKGTQGHGGCRCVWEALQGRVGAVLQIALRGGALWYLTLCAMYYFCKLRATWAIQVPPFRIPDSWNNDKSTNSHRGPFFLNVYHLTFAIWLL